MRRVFNFSAGPAALPAPVLEQAAVEMLSWEGSGMSVMEMSHRGPAFMSIAAEAEADFRALFAVPANYKVLFLQGGGTLQFAMVPLNLMRPGASADYVVTGEWSRKAIAEARRFGNVNEAASAADAGFTYAPEQSRWQLDPGAAYVHYCSNETIHGVEFDWVPDTGAVPLVADMSSHILSRAVDVARFGLIYAGAQKNMFVGPNGNTLYMFDNDKTKDVSNCYDACATAWPPLTVTGESQLSILQASGVDKTKIKLIRRAEARVERAAVIDDPLRVRRDADVVRAVVADDCACDVGAVALVVEGRRAVGDRVVPAIGVVGARSVPAAILGLDGRMRPVHARIGHANDDARPPIPLRPDLVRLDLADAPRRAGVVDLRRRRRRP